MNLLFQFSTQKQTASFSGQKLWSVEYLPSKDQLRCVRVLLRHLQYFSNHLLPEDCPMNDLKRSVLHRFEKFEPVIEFMYSLISFCRITFCREIFSNNRRTIYDFFHCSMTHLPLDSSYRVLLEGWFTYIQPWRYTNPYTKNMKYENFSTPTFRIFWLGTY